MEKSQEWNQNRIKTLQMKLNATTSLDQVSQRTGDKPYMHCFAIPVQIRLTFALIQIHHQGRD